MDASTSPELLVDPNNSGESAQKTKAEYVREEYDRRLQERIKGADPELVRRAVAAAEGGDHRKAEYWKAKALRLHTASGCKQLVRGLR